MTNYTKTIKQRIAKFLNSATATVVHSYERYLGEDLPETLEDKSKQPESFKKYHDAGKSAASHLESLLKLANATDDSAAREKAAQENQDQRELQKTMRKAQEEIDGR